MTKAITHENVWKESRDAQATTVRYLPLRTRNTVSTIEGELFTIKLRCCGVVFRCVADGISNEGYRNTQAIAVGSLSNWTINFSLQGTITPVEAEGRACKIDLNIAKHWRAHAILLSRKP